MPSGGSIAARMNHVAVYDEANKNMWICGGLAGSESGSKGATAETKETWVFNFESNKWTQKEDGPAISSAAGVLLPVAESGEFKIIVFGGLQNNTPQNTTWGYGNFPQPSYVRLYFTYPTDPNAQPKDINKNIGSAVSMDGISFTLESNTRISGQYITDPDVFEQTSGTWIMFYSKADSPTSPDNSTLYKATCSTANGTFSADSTFVGDQGNISGSFQIGNQWYTCTLRNGKLALNQYDTVANKLIYQKDITDGADPSVVKLTDKYLLTKKMAILTALNQQMALIGQMIDLSQQKLKFPAPAITTTKFICIT